MRPTTKDLAKAAGVSLATVDRVLNSRAGVRKKTIDAVNDAIESIGFERNHIAATLARQRGYRFGFVLPQVGDEFLDEILTQIDQCDKTSRAQMVEVKALRIDEQDPHAAARALGALDPSEFDGIAIMAPETPQIRDAIHRLRERGIQVVPFIADQVEGNDDSFVGIDNRAAGATAGRLIGRFSGQRAGTIAVITETIQARDSIERRLGFDGVINKDFPDLRVLPSLETHADPARTVRIIETIHAAHKDLIGIYLMGSEARSALEAIALVDAPRCITVAHEKTPSTVKALIGQQLDAVVNQDPGHLVRSAVRILKAKCENRPTLGSQERIRIEILLADNL